MRERIVQIAETHSKSETLKHFTSEGVPRSTVYSVLANAQERGTTERKPGTGRTATIMTNKRKSALARSIEGRLGVSTRNLSRKYGCTQQYVQKIIRKLGFKCYSRQKAPAYQPEQIAKVKSQSRWMHDHYGDKILVLDDEKYFTLSGPQNGHYYMRDNSEVADEVKFKSCEKFEKKVLVYLVASERGISEPFFAEGGLAVDQHVYTDQCLRRILVPFLQEYHADNEYVFWPDKASSHYSRKALDFLASNGINIVPKERNPTNLPQCRPIEDLWGQLVTLVYQGGWRAKTLKQLRRRVKACVKKLDLESVHRSFSSIRKSLRKVYQDGPFAAVH